MRVPCRVSLQVVLNEVVVDRGISPFLTNLECFCDGNFVTHVQVRHSGPSPPRIAAPALHTQSPELPSSFCQGSLLWDCDV